MKIVKVIIYILYLLVYVYGVHKTTVAPDEIIWGYICCGVILYLFITTVKFIINYSNKYEKNQDLL